jgi:hypothetical protein
MRNEYNAHPDGENMADQDNLAALKQHWTASASGYLETEHNIYDDNVLC